jgi:hypothetical protein
MTASSKLRRICKIINAAEPRRYLLSFDQNGHICAIRYAYVRHKVLYFVIVAAYINLHIGSSRYAFAASQPQSPAPQADRWPEPPPRACSCSVVPRRWILRLPRFGAGQVRDAATSAHRRSREDRGRFSFWCIAADVLSSGSGLCPGRLERTAAEVARSEGCTQAHARSHAVYRSAADRRRAARGSGPGSTDRDRTGCLGPPPQYRTRPGAQKKTIITAAALPPAAVSLYEILRSDVLRGAARPDGLGAVIYHGMLQGLVMLMSGPSAPTPWQPHMASAPNVRGDRGLVRLLANMVLQTHLEVKHVL